MRRGKTSVCSVNMAAVPTRCMPLDMLAIVASGSAFNNQQVTINSFENELTEMKARLDGLVRKQADGNLADDESGSGPAAHSVRKLSSRCWILTGSNRPDKTRMTSQRFPKGFTRAYAPDMHTTIP